MNLNRILGIRSKICLPFAITAVALLLMGILSALTFRDLVADTDDIAGNSLPAISEVLNADRDLYQALVAQMSFVDAASLGRDTANFKEDFLENASQAQERLNSAVNRLRGTGVEEKVVGVDTAYESWMTSAEKSMDLAESGIRQAAESTLKGESQSAFNELRAYFDVVGSHADEQAQKSAAHASAEAVSRSLVIMTAGITTVLVCVALFVIFLRMIVGSIKSLRDQLDNIAQGEGDLTQRVPVESKDDLGQLATSFNQVLANLQGMIGTIQALSDNLGKEARSLSTAARDNNDGVTRQSDLISMVATAMNQMQSAIEEVAGNASRAADVTRHAQETSRNGGEIIHNSSAQVQSLAEQIVKAVEVIRKLSQDSENITSVLDVIRGVAEQTNLLALNAAIEAARAGEQGRGFAVVADEVRTLAQRTQQSTEDIQRMITTLQTGVSDIVSVMETGSEQASETRSMASEAEKELKVILESMNDIMDVNTSVASATEEQTQVVEEINRNIVNINELASESSRRSGSISEISANLDSYADELRQQTGRFRV
ncbi:methyl-accepting chemotaxis protein [Marinobacter confluentis]|uniref:Methyl-accepting chemotaxis protein n=1 Tax=Marinobacter confluentis TaxID=1697557 RepID=A0A4Z1BZF7_9GAMM|nr:methyl-accepting chemotaxis protein [Marinobacter confluentis]TGN40078.1 methyl-accepting chemotaxis protein [Marinobacter confluentis]